MTEAITPQQRHHALPIVNLMISIGAAVLAVTSLTLARSDDSSAVPTRRQAAPDVTGARPATAEPLRQVHTIGQLTFYGCDRQIGINRC
jgi:hypothetical protein